MPAHPLRSLILAVVLGGVCVPALSAQFIAPLPRASQPCREGDERQAARTVADTAAARAQRARGDKEAAAKVETLCKKVFEHALKGLGQTWVFPPKYGRRYAQELYAHAQVGLFSDLGLNLRKDQLLATAEVVSGFIGASPVNLSTAFVKTEVDESEGGDPAAGEPTASQIADTRSRLAALTRNGGNVTVQYAVPLFISWGPNWRTTFAAAGEFGLLGDATDPDTVEPSWSASLDAALGFTIRDTRDSIKAAILLPIRLSRVGALDGIDDEMFPGDEAFTMIQLGFGLTDASENLRAAVLWNYPFDDEIRKQTPEFMINFQAVLPSGDEQVPTANQQGDTSAASSTTPPPPPPPPGS